MTDRSANRKVTERDLRLPEFRNADIDDLEFREDGKVVRKDRWETGIRAIVGILGVNGEFEVADVVQKAREMKPGYDAAVELAHEVGTITVATRSPDFGYLVHKVKEMAEAQKPETDCARADRQATADKAIDTMIEIAKVLGLFNPIEAFEPEEVVEAVKRLKREFDKNNFFSLFGSARTMGVHQDGGEPTVVSIKLVPDFAFGSSRPEANP